MKKPKNVKISKLDTPKPEAVRVSRKCEWSALDQKKHGIGGVINGPIKERKQDRRALPAEGYIVVFFPRIKGIGKARVDCFGFDYSWSASPEAALSKFMDRIHRSDKWEQYYLAGHRVRKVRVIDLGDAQLPSRRVKGK